MTLTELEKTTRSDEEGARAERLAQLRRVIELVGPGFGGMAAMQLAYDDFRFLLGEIDRTAADRLSKDRDTWKARAEKAEAAGRDVTGKALVEFVGHIRKAEVEPLRGDLTTAIASRNAWAEKCAELTGALREVVRAADSMLHITVTKRMSDALDSADKALASIEPEVGT